MSLKEQDIKTHRQTDRQTEDPGGINTFYHLKFAPVQQASPLYQLHFMRFIYMNKGTENRYPIPRSRVSRNPAELDLAKP